MSENHKPQWVPRTCGAVELKQNGRQLSIHLESSGRPPLETFVAEVLSARADELAALPAMATYRSALDNLAANPRPNIGGAIFRSGVPGEKTVSLDIGAYRDALTAAHKTRDAALAAVGAAIANDIEARRPRWRDERDIVREIIARCADLFAELSAKNPAQMVTSADATDAILARIAPSAACGTPSGKALPDLASAQIV